MRRFYPVLFLFSVTLGLPKAAKAEAGAEELFRSSIWPTLETSCVRCHGAEKHKGDLRLDSREAALKGGKDGAALVPGKPGESLMLKLVRHQDPDREMPPKDKLEDGAITDLEHWIAAGAPWPQVNPKTAPVAQGPPANGEHLGDAWSDPRNPIVKLFGGKRLDLWSLKPVTDPAPPTVKDVSWVRNPIDAFVLARLEAAGKKPAPEADRRTLARRLYFDLTGLPPTPEQMAAFLNDQDPEAYAHLVDELLGSRSYGEHWARMWLDVIRYSDSEGYDWDEFRREAWRFRDYVIRSFDADKPMNRLIREHLAGDEMVAGLPQTEAERDCLIGSGYLLLGPYDNSARKFGETRRAWSQLMSDLVETTGAAFLGLNFTCCRCHDHKYDPIAQSDYYRMRAFFEGVKNSSELSIDLPEQQRKVEQYNARIQAQIDEKHALCDRLLEKVKQELYEEGYAKLSDSEKALLKLPRDKIDADREKEIGVVEKSLIPSRHDMKSRLSREDKKLYVQMDNEADELEKKLLIHSTGFIATDESDRPPPTPFLLQGDFNQPRGFVTPGFPAVFDPNPAPVEKPARPHSSGRRTALADWIVSEKNPLTTRVLVNRVWQGHFGQALEATANDFGFAGAKPSNPELLDWLAREFVRNGWSMKKLHRLILTSATYRQGLAAEPSTAGDGEFASQQPHRLSAEALRDATLAVSGRLTKTAGGPPLWPELPEDVMRASPALIDENQDGTKGWYPSPHAAMAVRSIYMVQKRNVRVPMMEILDLPENSLSCPRRNVSTVAPQALTLLNSDFAAEAALSFAERLKKESAQAASPSQIIDRAFALAVQRPPTTKEREACVRFLERHSLAEFCRTLLNLNEFAYVD